MNDMFADAVVSAILKCESLQGSRPIPLPAVVDHVRFKVITLTLCLIFKLDLVIEIWQECLVEMLQDMFGDEAVSKVAKDDTFTVTVDGKRANISLSALVSCILSNS